MQSKTIQLFLALGLATSLGACGGANQEGEGAKPGEPPVIVPAPQAPVTTAPSSSSDDNENDKNDNEKDNEGGEGGEG
jgi:hypothetical protein